MFDKRTKGPAECPSCSGLLDDDAQICPCGKPTWKMSFAERNRYEAAQWRAYKARAST